jgi:hypothetical protein
MPTFEQEQAARRAHVLHELTTGPQPTGDACRCGRQVARLSPASPRPTCRGCGLPSELCPCKPPGEQRWRWDRVHPEIGDFPDEGATEP